MESERECHERVVLVSVRGGSKPRRKVAIALPPENDYDVFSERVRKKLNLSGIGGIYHSETNIPVYDLGDLQDIDDLVVVECVPDTPITNGDASDASANGPTQKMPSSATNLGSSISAGGMRKMGSLISGNDIETAVNMGDSADDDDNQKYAKRHNPVVRMMQQLTGSQCANLLPVTTKDTAEGSKTKRRRKGGALDPRKVLLMFALASCMATMILLYSRLSIGPALASGVMDENRDHLLSSETLNLGTR
uniref:Uncharacterized protein n=1 Tax=Pyramimonas obovata TaxID=1411642 RepID=A0A7S0WHG1_9CHLO|mmetsp:Transcript_2551/g.5313  ORF Transcript_2551/g.5313 Transcript_2551/m.5313 type:complete len:250 (+) Transcript_2551:272-1021(+)